MSISHKAIKVLTHLPKVYSGGKYACSPLPYHLLKSSKVIELDNGEEFPYQ